LFLGAGPARADTGDVAVAEALFRDGKDLLAQKDYARACPKLAESFRRDAATGTLLALAICHERDGKLASAWGEYADVASRSKAESRSDREKAARAKVQELESVVSRLTIALSDDAGSLAGLEIKSNGSVVATAVLGTSLPVDGGPYRIDAEAPGKKKWSTEIAIEPSGDKRTVRVPLLDDAKAAPPASAAAPAKKPISRAAPPPTEPAEAKETPKTPDVPEYVEPPRRGLTSIQRTGIATGMAGMVGLGVGTYFTFRAVSKNNDSKSGCVGDLCAPAAKQNRLDARTAGNFATVGFVGGGALAAAGVAMLVFGRGPEATATGASSPGLHALPMVSIDGVGGMLGGTF